MVTDSQGWMSASAVPKFRRAAWLAMIAMTMFFLALTYAYIVRRGISTYWLSSGLVRILAINTCILLASSVALVRARAFLELNQLRGTLRWTATAFGLGLLFLAGQAYAWHTLFQSGIYLEGHPNSGFFYLVTAAHAAHLALALTLLGWVLSRAWRGLLHADRPLLMDLTGIVWHCLDITWVYLFLVLTLYR